MAIKMAWSVPKDVSMPLDNEDLILFNEELGRYVICDGASESFDSKSWAGILAERFIETPCINQDWLEGAISAYEQRYDVATLSWSKQAAYERGSYSTLLGLCTDHDGGLELLVIGDSLAILVKDDLIAAAAPYQAASDFLNRPTLLSTSRGHLPGFLEPEQSEARRIHWPRELVGKGSILLMTDALGEWVLRLNGEGNLLWKALLEMKSVDEFTELILSQRADRAMRIDDSSLLVIHPE